LTTNLLFVHLRASVEVPVVITCIKGNAIALVKSSGAVATIAPAEQGAAEQGAAEQGAAGQGAAEQGAAEQGAAGQGAAARRKA